MTDTFNSDFKVHELITALKDVEFHRERAKSKSLKKLECDNSKHDQLNISRQIDFDIPVSAQKLVSNPISILEEWDFNLDESVDILLSITNIQTTVKAHLNFEENSMTVVNVKSVVDSKIFLMSSFVEEFVSKYWKKTLTEDFAILNEWIKA
ncbi:MAG: DUF2505 family protein [Candidatus Nanopelagicales bacterium]|nr:DUF2505 family protein [Candidatus Nanopelagicales bacterium]